MTVKVDGINNNETNNNINNNINNLNRGGGPIPIIRVRNNIPVNLIWKSMSVDVTTN